VLFDRNGKVSLEHIYTAPDPRPYFTTLRKLDYGIPQLAKPHFAGLIRQLRAARGGRPVNVLDLGCSYGINAVLLRCDASMDELYERYGGIDASVETRAGLLARDRELVRTRDRRPGTRFVGLDVSAEALSYAAEAGFLDGAVRADLERADPTPEQRDQLAGIDLVVSTGCLGYVTEQTIARVVRAAGPRRPWMAHFVLRMYPFEPVRECLAEFGYDTVSRPRLFPQRRFASPDEQSLVLSTLTGLGIDPVGAEAEGWLYAELFVSRPRGA
jgi:SAM-dependent methyltransferase